MKISNTENNKKVKEELLELKKKEKQFLKDSKLKPGILKFKNILFETNKKLWNVEDKIRQLESEKDFGKEFIKSARLIYRYNDFRFKIKNEINLLLNYKDGEVKEHNIERKKK